MDFGTPGASLQREYERRKHARHEEMCKSCNKEPADEPVSDDSQPVRQTTSDSSHHSCLTR
jgi:hypothetical protein